MTPPLNYSIRYAYYLTRRALRRRRHQYLFILGHMRSGSSLLVHLLNSHPQIAGFGESHSAFHTERDLTRLYCRIKLSLRDNDFSEQYLLDKILHERHVVADEYLHNPDFFYLFLLREPGASMASYIRFYTKVPTVPDPEPHEAFDYYTGRLKDLQRYAETIDQPGRLHFITHDEILNDTEQVFQGLEEWLGLQSPLTEEYKTTPITGRGYFGDRSDAIKSGAIDRKASVKPDLSIFTDEQLQEAQQVFDETCELLRMRQLELKPQ